MRYWQIAKLMTSGQERLNLFDHFFTQNRVQKWSFFIGLFQTVRLSKWYLHFDTPSIPFLFLNMKGGNYWIALIYYSVRIIDYPFFL